MTEREREFLRWVRGTVAEICRAAGPEGAKGITDTPTGQPVTQLDAVQRIASMLYAAVRDHLDPDPARPRAKRAAQAEKAERREPAS
jgi:hypothetical protein